ncbi:MAG TPA: 2-phosphosulfolactate phosphatase [Candidatus Binatia bacterium]|jgi:2-phosphosulfolactate phosphatase|nr:2-phosphosulfolactate phosphatase [Candidatus Binatia bacterium]
MTTLEVLFTPADFAALNQRDLSQTICVVFDVLRATSTMVTALNNGTAAIIPVAEISEAVELRRRQPEVLLAGERDGVRIPSHLTGGLGFDLGNSPREFTAEKVSGRTIVMSTTNGTRAMRACTGAQLILAGSFLNLRTTAGFLEKLGPQHLLLVCSGTIEEAAYEDILGAGALCDLLWTSYSAGAVADSAYAARRLFRLERGDLLAALSASRNGRRLLARPELSEDVPFCLQQDSVDLVAQLDKEGRVQRRKE